MLLFLALQGWLHCAQAGAARAAKLVAVTRVAARGLRAKLLTRAVFAWLDYLRQERQLRCEHAVLERMAARVREAEQLQWIGVFRTWSSFACRRRLALQAIRQRWARALLDVTWAAWSQFREALQLRSARCGAMSTVTSLWREEQMEILLRTALYAMATEASYSKRMLKYQRECQEHLEKMQAKHTAVELEHEREARRWKERAERSLEMALLHWDHELRENSARQAFRSWLVFAKQRAVVKRSRSAVSIAVERAMEQAMWELMQHCFGGWKDVRIEALLLERPQASDVADEVFARVKALMRTDRQMLAPGRKEKGPKGKHRHSGGGIKEAQQQLHQPQSLGSASAAEAEQAEVDSHGHHPDDQQDSWPAAEPDSRKVQKQGPLWCLRRDGDSLSFADWAWCDFSLFADTGCLVCTRAPSAIEEVSASPFQSSSVAALRLRRPEHSATCRPFSFILEHRYEAPLAGGEDSRMITMLAASDEPDLEDWLLALRTLGVNDMYWSTRNASLLPPEPEGWTPLQEDSDGEADQSGAAAAAAGAVEAAPAWPSTSPDWPAATESNGVQDSSFTSSVLGAVSSFAEDVTLSERPPQDVAPPVEPVASSFAPESDQDAEEVVERQAASEVRPRTTGRFRISPIPNRYPCFEPLATSASTSFKQAAEVSVATYSPPAPMHSFTEAPVATSGVAPTATATATAVAAADAEVASDSSEDDSLEELPPEEAATPQQTAAGKDSDEDGASDSEESSEADSSDEDLLARATGAVDSSEGQAKTLTDNTAWPTAASESGSRWPSAATTAASPSANPFRPCASASVLSEADVASASEDLWGPPVPLDAAPTFRAPADAELDALADDLWGPPVSDGTADPAAAFPSSQFRSFTNSQEDEQLTSTAAFPAFESSTSTSSATPFGAAVEAKDFQSSFSSSGWPSSDAPAASANPFLTNSRETAAPADAFHTSSEVASFGDPFHSAAAGGVANYSPSPPEAFASDQQLAASAAAELWGEEQVPSDDGFKTAASTSQDALDEAAAVLWGEEPQLARANSREAELAHEAVLDAVAEDLWGPAEAAPPVMFPQAARRPSLNPFT